MMYAIQLDMYQAAAVAALVLLLGRFLVRNLDLLRRYCIPEPVAGGVVFALAHLALRQAGILEISFDSALQTFFMVVFFCSVGFTACFRLLKKGGAIDSGRFLNAALCLALAIGAGTVVSAWLNKVFTFPIYIGAMLVAAFIRNTTDMAGKEIPMEEISTIGSFSLSLFLGLAMMGLKLWELADLAVPMVVMLVAQTVLMMVYAYFVVFNLLGKNYDAAVMTSGFCGFGMGATPNAMANMQAITQKYGPAPTAYFVVPLVGSLFIDFMNTIIITSFLNLL